MNYGDSYLIHNLYLNDFRTESIFPKIETKDNLITLYEIETIAHNRMINQEIPIKHLLTFQEGDFVEYNPNPKEYAIDSIIISMSCPWWGNSKYSFRIDDKIALGWVNNNNEKISLSRFSAQQWTKIKKRLNYADFPTIDLPKYGIMDNITYKTTIYYNNGLSHTIMDNHGYANRSLSLIYKEIMPLKGKMDEILNEKYKPRLPGLK